jgi:hypothetical protein
MPPTRSAIILSPRLELIVSTSVNRALNARSFGGFSAPPDLQKKIDCAVASAWAPSTRRLYNNAILRFMAFCDSLGVPPVSRLPAAEDLLCAFAASSLGRRSASSIRNDLSGIRAWHLFHSVPYSGGSRLSLVIRGSEIHSPPSSKRAPRVAVSLTMLSSLYDRLSLYDPFDVACLATALVAFWGQCRLGEILPDKCDGILPSFYPARSDLRAASSTGASRILHLPWTKVAKSRGEDVVVCQQFAPCDPLSALDLHLSINALPSPSLLFTVASGPHAGPLTRPKFLARCNSIWSSLGLLPVTGHCFRIGGTTELLVRGVPPDVVRMLGRWSSDSFLRYWRCLDSIAPLYVASLPNSSSPAASSGGLGLPRGRASSSAPAPPRCGRIRLRLTAPPRHG